MPYFQDLEELAREVHVWADLRHEQGGATAPVVARLRRALKQARQELARLPVDRALQAAEPDGLEAIRRLRPEGPRIVTGRLTDAQYRKRLKGAWLGRAAGCALGAPVENWTIDAMERLAARCGVPFPPRDYWPGHPQPDEPCYLVSRIRDFLKGHMRAVPADDDLGYTLLGLLILEAYGPDFTTEEVGDAWVKYLPMACTAEHVALENLKRGVPAQRAGVLNNPYLEWIGADIRCDPWAYAAPGWPEKAAEWAYRDARLSHRRNGVYGALFFAAAISAAFVVDDPLEALRLGLTEIPAGCRLAKDIQWALRKAPGLTGWREARALVDERFQGMHAVHTNNNACLTVFGLALGKRDFTRTIGVTVAMGLDNDCTAATAGSLLGAVLGIDGVPEHWWKPFRNRARTYLNHATEFRNSDIVRRFEKVRIRP